MENIDLTKAVPAQGLTLVTYLLDRTGSMLTIKEATIEAFNGYLAGLKIGDARIEFSLIQFDSISIDKNYVGTPINDVQPLTQYSFQPRGSTPLIDACVKTIRAVDAQVGTKPLMSKVVICFHTDGEENASREHTWEQLHGMVVQKQALGWQFNFMGAGIDAYKQAAKMGIGAMSTVSYNAADKQQTEHAFSAQAVNTQSFAAGRSASTHYTVEQKIGSGDAFLGGVSVTPIQILPHAKLAPIIPARDPPKAVDDFTL